MIPIILICIVLNTNGFLLRSKHNSLFKNSADYNIDIIINEDDYEMVDKNQLKNFSLNNKEFIELNNIARKEYYRTAEYTTMVSSYRDLKTSPPTKIAMTDKRNKKILTTTLGRFTTLHAINKREIAKKNEIEYNYSNLINEYYAQTDNETFSKSVSDYSIIHSFKRIFLLNNDNNNKSIGLQAIKNLMHDYKHQRCSTKDVVTKVWRIARIWLLVYLVVAVPLWCTRGWCCCCLLCKFFKPRQTIEEAKKYLITNPPGLYKTKNGDVLYDPTEREIETYEEFEHFIKIL